MAVGQERQRGGFLHRTSAEWERRKPARKRTRRHCYDEGLAIDLRYDAGFYAPAKRLVSYQTSTDVFASPFGGGTADAGYQVEAYDNDDSAHSIEEPIPDAPEVTQQSWHSRALSAAEYPQASRFAPAASVNYRTTPAGTQRQINRVIIHITDGGSKIAGTVGWFQNPNQRNRHGKPINVSAHYVVGQDGEVVQMVMHNDVAWHAGSANSDSIGIEHVANTRDLRPTEAEYCASAALVSWLCDQFSIPKDRQHILGHAEADPNTSHKACPNAVWDWDYFMRMVRDNACYPISAQQSFRTARMFSEDSEVDSAPIYGAGELEDLFGPPSTATWLGLAQSRRRARAMEDEAADAEAEAESDGIIYGTAELEDDDATEADDGDDDNGNSDGDGTYSSARTWRRKRSRAFDEEVQGEVDAPVYGTGELETEASEALRPVADLISSSADSHASAPPKENDNADALAQVTNAFGWHKGASEDPDTMAFENDLKAILGGQKTHPSTTPPQAQVQPRDDEDDDEPPAISEQNMRPHASSFTHDDFDRWGVSMNLSNPTTYNMGRFSLGKQFESFDREMDANARMVQRKRQDGSRAQSFTLASDEIEADVAAIVAPTPAPVPVPIPMPVSAMTAMRTRTLDAFNVNFDVPLVPQQTGMSCWAAGCAMLVAWRGQMSVDPSEIALASGHWAQYQTGLAPEDVSVFPIWGMAAVAPQTYTVQGFYELLDRYGPLWVASAEPGPHIRVVTGMSGDGTPDGTILYINDPWEQSMTTFRLPNVGAQYTETYTAFVHKQTDLARNEIKIPGAIYVAHLNQIRQRN